MLGRSQDEEATVRVQAGSCHACHAASEDCLDMDSCIIPFLEAGQEMGGVDSWHWGTKQGPRQGLLQQSQAMYLCKALGHAQLTR